MAFTALDWNRHEWCVICHWHVTVLDFADDICMLAEMLGLLVPVSEVTATETVSLGLEVNWQDLNCTTGRTEETTRSSSDYLDKDSPR